jgi:hypothetical protein
MWRLYERKGKRERNKARQILLGLERHRPACQGGAVVRSYWIRLAFFFSHPPVFAREREYGRVREKSEGLIQ